MLDLQRIENDLVKALEQCSSLHDLNQVKSFYLGKKSELAEGLKSIPTIEPDQRKDFAKSLNITKQKLENLIKEHSVFLEEKAIQDQLDNERIDVSMYPQPSKGSMHLSNRAIYDVVSIMQSMGFSYRENNEIESIFNNFTGLNIPENHPARAEQDTFYTTDGRVLRTHTSSVQIHVMQEESPPIRVVCPGRVFRNDQDRTHSPMFHQLECLCIDEHVNMSMLLETIRELLRSFFGKEIPIRLRPNYFPFTEPSAEVDIQFEGKWLEVLGCGMVHPNVLKMSHIPEGYRGFAFGVGIDRLVMLRHGINDLREIFDNHPGFLEQFRG
jgi:phenylalanyl-tRNA synthetase alpha chain